MAALIRCGKLCRECTSAKCAELSGQNEIQCPQCCGKGCDNCAEGYVDIAGCPNTYCASVVPAIELIDLFGKGMPPIAGGALDQSVSFIQAARYLTNEERQIKNGD